MNVALLRWWVIACSVLTASGYMAYQGLFEQLWVVDQSKISVGILFIFVVMSGFLGHITKHIQDSSKDDLIKYNNYLPSCWFAAEALTGLGMLGTLIGFLIMLGSFDNLAAAIGNVESSRLVIGKLATGMGTALITTLVGLACSLLLKLQLVNVETTYTDEDLQ